MGIRFQSLYFFKRLDGFRIWYFIINHLLHIPYEIVFYVFPILSDNVLISIVKVSVH